MKKISLLSLFALTATFGFAQEECNNEDTTDKTDEVVVFEEEKTPDVTE